MLQDWFKALCSSLGPTFTIRCKQQYLNLDISQLLFADSQNLSLPDVDIRRVWKRLLNTIRHNLTIRAIQFIWFGGLGGSSPTLRQQLIWWLTSHRFAVSYWFCPTSQSIRHTMLMPRPLSLAGECPSHSASNRGNSLTFNIIACWLSSAWHVYHKSRCQCV